MLYVILFFYCRYTSIKVALEAEDGWTPERIAGMARLKEAQDKKLAQQEPVAWRYRWSVEGGNWVWNYATYIERQKNDRCEPLYTTPPPCPTCEALARTVMLDQTGRDA